jgi:hypothetical protein
VDPLRADVKRLRSALLPVEAGAREQVWDEKRPWRVRSHVGVEDGRPVVDLHDLKARNARVALDGLLSVAAELESRSVLVVTGRGAHSMGPAVLRQLAGDRLAAAASRTDGWSLHPQGSGAWVLSTDPDANPSGRANWFLVLFFLLLALALAWLVFGRGAGLS